MDGGSAPFFPVYPGALAETAFVSCGGQRAGGAGSEMQPIEDRLLVGIVFTREAQTRDTLLPGQCP